MVTSGNLCGAVPRDSRDAQQRRSIEDATSEDASDVDTTVNVATVDVAEQPALLRPKISPPQAAHGDLAPK